MNKENTSRQLLLISREISHHSRMSGYGQLANYLPGISIDNSRKELLPWTVLRYLSRTKDRPCYSSLSLNKELIALKSMLGRRKGILHYLYLDNDFRLSPILASRLNYKLTGTLHHPPEMLNQVFAKLADLRKLDGIFCVSENQADFVKDIVNHERVWFVPHGIDVNFFSPQVALRERPSCLFVGAMLRDFELLKAVILQLQKKRRDLFFTVIVAREKQALFSDLPGVRVLSGVADTQLRDEYRKATLLLLPLTNCTANNSILEAISCGLPVITTDVGGIRSYLDDSCAILCKKGDADAMTEATLNLLADDALLSDLRVASRNRALLFSWDNVKVQVLNIFNKYFDFETTS